uniref:Helicase swr1 n=1 Tax=Ascaris lumbricoides TaxID=6252 RepID=A0A0M3I559_ASCLU
MDLRWRVQDSQSRCAVPRGVSSEADTDAAKRGVADEPSIDDEAERLRAALLEQVKRKKHLEERAEAALNNREEGEVSSSTTPIHSPGVTQHTTSNSFDTALHPQSRTVGCNSSAIIPSSSLEHNSKARSIRSVITPSKDSRVGRKRPARQRRLNSSDNETTVLSDFSDAPPRKRSNTKRRIKSSGRGASHQSANISCLPSREHSLEEWERLLEEEAEEKRLIENKMRHREAQRSMNASKRDRYLERAYRCCQEIGFFDSELMMLKGDLEKVKGRISFFEKECEKARKAESRRTAEKKAAERSRNKEIYRRRLSGNSVAVIDVDVLRSSGGSVSRKGSKEVDSGRTGLADLNEDTRDENPRETGVQIRPDSRNDEQQVENVNGESTESDKVAKRKGVCRIEEVGSRTLSNESSGQREGGIILEPEQELQFNINVVGGASEDMEMGEERNEALRSSSDEDLENWCLLDSAEQDGSDADRSDKHCHRLLPLNAKPTTMQLSDDGDFCSEDFDEDALSGTMHHSETSSTQREMMATSNKEAVTASEMRLRSGSTSNVSYDGGNFAELRDNLLLRFSGYRICPTFPYNLITHRSISNKLDPMRPLCYYELHGICKDKFCTMYVLSYYFL